MHVPQYFLIIVIQIASIPLSKLNIYFPQTSDEVKYISFGVIFVPLFGIDAVRDAREVDGSARLSAFDTSSRDCCGGDGEGYGGGGGKFSSGKFGARNVEQMEFISMLSEIL
jgi:hypothetical protein